MSGSLISDYGLDRIIAPSLVGIRLTDLFTQDNGGNGIAITGPLAVQDVLSNSNKGAGVVPHGAASGSAAALIAGEGNSGVMGRRT